MSKMTDKENTKQKIKAIYPHIVVGGDIDKPCYNIHWYDIEQKTMICGFGSYKLELVRKWLEEEFEVVERDIDNLIKSQETEIERLREEVKAEYGATFLAKTEAIKEFAERLKGIERWTPTDLYVINNLVKEMVGEGK